MGKFSLFKKKTSENINPNDCTHLTTTQDCNLVSEIRQAQEELSQVEEKIHQLETYGLDMLDMTEIKNFFFAEELHYLHYKIADSRRYDRKALFDMSDMRFIHGALTHITDIDKFIFEVKTILNRSQMIADEQNKAAELRKKISEAKGVLGIK